MTPFIWKMEFNELVGDVSCPPFLVQLAGICDGLKRLEIVFRMALVRTGN